MYEDFGAVVKNSSVTFKLFFPDNAIDPGQYQRGGLPYIKTLRVTGNFQSKLGGSDWDFASAPILEKKPHLHGWLYEYTIPQIAHGFYEYKYFVEFENATTRWCGDPCSKYCGSENENVHRFVISGRASFLPPATQSIREYACHGFPLAWQYESTRRNYDDTSGQVSENIATP